MEKEDLGITLLEIHVFNVSIELQLHVQMTDI